jgi:hypothetical protein
MIDRKLTAFLERQEKDALALNAESDLVEIVPLEPTPNRRYIVRYRVKGLVRTKDGVVGADDFGLGVYFPLDYIQRANPAEVLTLLWPENAFHPNLLFPWICPGALTAGTTLVEVVCQCAEIISYQKVTMREDRALDRDACCWARKHKERFPIDARPLRRRPVCFHVTNVETPAGNSCRGEGP